MDSPGDFGSAGQESLRPVRRHWGSALLVVAAAVGSATALSAGVHASVLEASLALLAAAVIPAVAAVSVLRRPDALLSAADAVTLLRVVLTGFLTAALVLMWCAELPPRTWLVAGVAAVALLLDAVDGWVARSTDSASDAGARLDMQSDAAALLIISALAAATVGPWVLAMGAMRYVFAAVSRLRPRLRAPLAYSRFRRTVAALQGPALLPSLIPIVAPSLAMLCAAVGLALLLVSFGRDVLRLEATAQQPETTAHEHQPREQT